MNQIQTIKRSSIIDIAKGLIGSPSIKYRNPNLGNTLEGFDCSGFVQHVLLQAEIHIPDVPNTQRQIRYSEEFFDYFGITIHEEHSRRGDLIFFSGTGIKPTHLGFYNGNGEMIHSPGKDGMEVEVRNIQDYVRENPLEYPQESLEDQIYCRNPIGFKRITSQLGDRYQVPVEI